MKQQALKYWHSLKEKEQQLLIFGGITFVLFILVMGIVRPLNTAVIKAEKEVVKHRNLVSWVESSIAKIKQSKPASVRSSGNLSQLINRTRGQYQIAISKMQPNSNSVRLSIDSAQFNQLVAWLDELTNQHGVKIVNLDLAQHDQPGHVRISRLVLEK